MNRNKRIGIAFVLVCLFLVSGRMLTNVSPETHEALPSLTRLRSQHLRLLGAGHLTLISDLLQARALSFYGAHRSKNQPKIFNGLDDLFLQAFELDPSNRDLIVFAANTLVQIDLQKALNLLDHGMRMHPNYWKFPELAGFIHYYYRRDSAAAAQMYARASRLPGHPPFVPSIASKLYEESGFYLQAIGVLKNLSAGNADPRIRAGFEEQVADIEGRIRLRRYRVPVKIRNVLSGTRLELEMTHHNPYPELNQIITVDLQISRLTLVGPETALMQSVWQQWTDRPVWMKLQTGEDGQLLGNENERFGTLQGDGGEDLVDALIRDIRSRPTLGALSDWAVHLGRFVTIRGTLTGVRTQDRNLVVIWKESGLPEARIDSHVLGIYPPDVWQALIFGLDGRISEVSALLSTGSENQPQLRLIHPDQINSMPDISE